jgi:adenosylcobinamide-phosphate synthase
MVGGLAGWVLLGKGAVQIAGWLPCGLGLIAEAWLFKTTFALRGLAQAAIAVHGPLAQGDLPQARQQLSWHLVSRDTSQLDAAQVAAATIESVAENASDGVLAPLLYYAIGGLPAALGYRFLNTADAMWGYRDPAREWLGKPAAWLDDLANLLPARLTALCLLLAAPLCDGDLRRGWLIWRRDAGTTASPNAGHPMSAMAGALGMALEKVGHYRLGAGQRQPTGADITRAVRLLRVAMIGAFGVVVALLGWLGIRNPGVPGTPHTNQVNLASLGRPRNAKRRLNLGRNDD